MTAQRRAEDTQLCIGLTDAFTMGPSAALNMARTRDKTAYALVLDSRAMSAQMAPRKGPATLLMSLGRIVEARRVLETCSCSEIVDPRVGGAIVSVLKRMVLCTAVYRYTGMQ